MVCRIMTAELLVPSLVGVLRPLSCTNTWLATGWKCYTGGHLALVFITLITSAASVPIIVMCTLWRLGWSI